MRISLDGIDPEREWMIAAGRGKFLDMPATRMSFAREPDPFFTELTRRVREYLSAPGRSRYAGLRMWLKTATIVALIVLGGVAIYSGRLAGAAFVMTFAAWQFAQFLTTIGIAHDAIHGAYSRNQTINRWMGRIFDVLGIDSRHWIDTHVHSHHASPNVPLLDSAIESFSLVRLHPRTRGGPIHRYQHLYMFLVYAWVTIFQVYLLEPVAFAQNVVGFARRSGWRADLAQMLLKKALVLGYSLVLPLVLLRNPWPEIVGGWLLGHALCGLAIGIIFQTTHLHQGTSFIEPDPEGRLPNTYAMHILKTTSEFSVENPLVTWIAGGLNLHVTHHLFPTVSQTHLPALSRIVRETAREFGVPYVAYSFFGALRSHVRALKRLGALPSDDPNPKAVVVRDPPRLGVLEVLRAPKRFTRTRTEILYDAALRYGPIVRLPSPFTKMYLVSHPSAVKRVLVDNVSNYRKSEEYELLSQWIGRGLITTEGDVWASDRRMLQPAFHRALLDRLTEQMMGPALNRVQTWSRTIQTAGSLEVDILEEMMDLSLVFIGLRLFGRDISVQARELSALMGNCQKYVTNRMLAVDFSRREFRQNVQRVREILAPFADNPEPDSIAALLAERGFDRAAHMDQLVGLFVAGHETTAVALTWTLLLLAKHPLIQERIRREGDSFLRATLDESLRLYPPVPCFGRRAIDDDILEGFLIPSGSKVILAQHVTHRLPEFWKDPETFDPERFLPDRRREICGHAYFPFGMGRRTCIGSAMAMLECRLTLSLLLERFTFEMTGTEEPKPVAMLSLRPDRQVILRVTECATKRASSSAPRAPSPPHEALHHRTDQALEESPSTEWRESTA